MPRSKPGETTSEILGYLSDKNLSDGVTKYEIWKSNDQLSRSTVYNVVRSLRKQGLLRRRKAGETPTGQVKYHYALTLCALITIMHMRKELWSDIGMISSKQVELLPLLFGKWNCLMRHEWIRDILLPKLQVTFELIWGRIIRPSWRTPFEYKESDLPLDDTHIRLMIYRRILSPERFEEEADVPRREYMRAIAGDQELSKFVGKLSELEEPRIKYKATNYKAAQDAIRSEHPVDFANLSKPEGWTTREDVDSQLKSLMHRLEEDIVHQ